MGFFSETMAARGIGTTFSSAERKEMSTTNSTSSKTIL